MKSLITAFSFFNSKILGAHLSDMFEQIVIIMRGLPGSGKSHVAKLIRVSGVTPANHSVIL